MSAGRGSVVAVWRRGEGGGRLNAMARATVEGGGWESFKMAAIRDGLGRVRVAGEAIYQSWREREDEREILVEGCFNPDDGRYYPPFLVSLLLFSLVFQPRRLILRFPFFPLRFVRSPSYRLFCLCSPSIEGEHPPPNLWELVPRRWSPRVRSRKYKRQRRD